MKSKLICLVIMLSAMSMPASPALADHAVWAQSVLLDFDSNFMDSCQYSDPRAYYMAVTGKHYFNGAFKDQAPTRSGYWLYRISTGHWHDWGKGLYTVNGTHVWINHSRTTYDWTSYAYNDNE